MGGKRSVCGHKGEQVTRTSTCTAEISLFALSLSQHSRLGDSLHQHVCVFGKGAKSYLALGLCLTENPLGSTKQEVKTQLAMTAVMPRRYWLKNHERTSEESHHRGCVTLLATPNGFLGVMDPLAHVTDSNCG